MSKFIDIMCYKMAAVVLAIVATTDYFQVSLAALMIRLLRERHARQIGFNLQHLGLKMQKKVNIFAWNQNRQPQEFDGSFELLKFE